ITTMSVPLATYPTAMKAAAILLDADKMDEAKVALYTALNTLVIETEVIPLPILRAEVMIAAAMTEDAKDEDKKKEVLNLLDNAEYQLIMAEELGYGKRDKEYKELNKSIKEIKKSVKEDGDSQGLFSKLKNKLKNFKNRTSSKSSNK
ncbi:YfdX family protein, partial [Maribacter sp. UBA849]